MDSSNRIAQVYGYTACLVALIVGLISAPMIINAAFDRANPLQAESGYGVSLISFESYQVTYQRDRGPVEPGKAEPSEGDLRKRYDALVAERLATTRYRTSKALFSGIVLMVLAIGLFAFHWRWLKRV